MVIGPVCPSKDSLSNATLTDTTKPDLNLYSIKRHPSFKYTVGMHHPSK